MNIINNVIMNKSEGEGDIGLDNTKDVKNDNFVILEKNEIFGPRLNIKELNTNDNYTLKTVTGIALFLYQRLRP